MQFLLIHDSANHAISRQAPLCGTNTPWPILSTPWRPDKIGKPDASFCKAIIGLLVKADKPVNGIANRDNYEGSGRYGRHCREGMLPAVKMRLTKARPSLNKLRYVVGARPPFAKNLKIFNWIGNPPHG